MAKHLRGKAWTMGTGICLLALAGCQLGSTASAAPAEDKAAGDKTAPTSQPAAGQTVTQIYDEQAALPDLLPPAVARAKAEGRRVLMVIGGNWCSWCRKLHALFATDTEVGARLARHYVILPVDVRLNKAALAKRGIETQGVPFLVVLDGQGKIVVQQETGSLEKGDAHDPGKVIGFLERWKP